MALMELYIIFYSKFKIFFVFNIRYLKLILLLMKELDKKKTYILLLKELNLKEKILSRQFINVKKKISFLVK